ncbi:lustrin, cysteine-rich repeated domain-containing protein [Ditylenchus destructor]|nr:lustrin, cysteine-rich repeated domain-containing protein [Ditylenchus destructor]
MKRCSTKFRIYFGPFAPILQLTAFLTIDIIKSVEQCEIESTRENDPTKCSPLNPSSVSDVYEENNGNQSEPIVNAFGFESTRYGLKLDICPNGARPEFTSFGNVKWCQGNMDCSLSYECVAIIGLNHFGTQIRYCCPTRTTICTLKPTFVLNNGGRNCRGRVIERTVYYFDINKLKCFENHVAECHEDSTSPTTNILIVDNNNNENQFASIAECRTKCETTACQLGESMLLINRNLDNVVMCQISDDCPNGYICRQDKLFQRGVCCGYTSFEPCPLGLRSFIVPFTGRPKTCFRSPLRDDCPADFACSQNDIDQLNYCCTWERGICPGGTHPYIHPMTDRTIKCNPQNYDAACPHGYVCSARVMGSYWGFCCSVAVVYANCPEQSTPLLNHISNQPRKCSDDSICGVDYMCYKSDQHKFDIGFCCSRPSSLNSRLLPTSQIHKTTTAPTMPTETVIDTEIEEINAVAGPYTRLIEPAQSAETSTAISIEASEEFGSEIETSTVGTSQIEDINTQEWVSKEEQSQERETEEISKSKDPSICLYAVSDTLGRSLCCVSKYHDVSSKDENSDEAFSRSNHRDSTSKEYNSNDKDYHILHEMYGGRDIYCVRHCEREDNDNPYWFYNSRLTKDNPPLSERGTDQAKEIARGLASVQIDYAFSSPCRRTVETASYILAGRSTKLCLEPGLLESESIILGNGVGSCSFESDFEIEPLFPGLVNDSYPRLYANVIPGEVGLYGCRARVQKSIANILRCSPHHISNQPRKCSDDSICGVDYMCYKSDQHKFDIGFCCSRPSSLNSRLLPTSQIHKTTTAPTMPTETVIDTENEEINAVAGPYTRLIEPAQSAETSTAISIEASEEFGSEIESSTVGTSQIEDINTQEWVSKEEQSQERETEEISKSKDPSICLYAVSDTLGRSLCCVSKYHDVSSKDENSDETFSRSNHRDSTSKEYNSNDEDYHIL